MLRAFISLFVPEKCMMLDAFLPESLRLVACVEYKLDRVLVVLLKRNDFKSFACLQPT